MQPSAVRHVCRALLVLAFAATGCDARKDDAAADAGAKSGVPSGYRPRLLGTEPPQARPNAPTAETSSATAASTPALSSPPATHGSAAASPKHLSDPAARKAELQKLGLDLLAAVKDKDAKKIETILTGLAGTQDLVTHWFQEAFGDDRGEDLTKEWEATIAKHLPELVVPFRDAVQKGQTAVVITAFDSPDAPGVNPLQKIALAAMRKTRTLYTMTLAKPGETTGFSLWSFVYEDGRFLLLGKMGRAKG